jgi:hypothetical protein|tara:strand:+ start:230 stop:1408 length:1179 start_codon:yes stop_codon:yes gene_type:complete
MSEDNKDFSVAGLAKEFVNSKSEGFEVAANEMEAHGVETELEYVEEEPEATEEVKEEVKEEIEDTGAEETGTTEETESDSSLNTEEVSTEATKETEKMPQASFNEELVNRTDGKYTTIDEVLDAITQQGEPQKFEYGNELIAKMDELVKKGVNVDKQFILEQMVNYSDIDHSDVNQAIELVKRKIRLEDPEITDREMKWELQDRYKLDEDEYSEDDIERSKARLSRDARKAKKELVDYQQSNHLPEGGVDLKKQEAQKEYVAKINSTLKSTLNEYKQETINIGDESFDYKFDAETKSLIEKDVMNTDKRYSRYFDSKGNLDSKQLATDEAWANPATRSKMLNAFLKQATSTGSKEVVKDLKNSSLSSKKNPKQQSKSFGLSSAIQNHFAKKG